MEKVLTTVLGNKLYFDYGRTLLDRNEKSTQTEERRCYPTSLTWILHDLDYSRVSAEWRTCWNPCFVLPPPNVVTD